MDLLDFFRGVHPWSKLRRLLDNLSGDSRYIKAQQNDPEVAEHIASQENGDEPWEPQNEDFTFMHELVAELRDLMADLVVITARGLPSNGQRKFPDRFPRPTTALSKARERWKKQREEREDEELLALGERAKARWRANQAAQAVETAAALEGSDELGVIRQKE